VEEVATTGAGSVVDCASAWHGAQMNAVVRAASANDRRKRRRAMRLLLKKTCVV
jgi:hypothetical protein